MSPSKQSNMLTVGAIALSTLLLFAVSAEVAARFVSKPQKTAAADVSVVPGGHLFKKDASLGYTQLPGRFVVTLDKSLSFRLTHLSNGLRITRPLEQYQVSERRPEIWIFGCSFTHGWAVNDKETYSWLLQERLPEYDVVNFGTEGYGTVQSLLQLQQALSSGRRPKIAVLAYASFHDIRNSLTRQWRMLLASNNRLGEQISPPYARLDRRGALLIKRDEVLYQPLPLERYSALSRLLDSLFLRYEWHLLDSRKISRAVIREFASTAKNAGIPFVLAGIDPPSLPTLAAMRAEGIPTADISVDFDLKIYNQLPIDVHPSPLAHQVLARKLESGLTGLHLLHSDEAYRDRNATALASVESR